MAATTYHRSPMPRTYHPNLSVLSAGQPRQRASHSEPATPTDELLDTAATYAREYLSAIVDRSIAPSPEAIDRLAILGGPLPESASDPAETLARLHRVGSPAIVSSASGRYFGFVIGGAFPVATATNWLADAWDQNAGPLRPLSRQRLPRSDRAGLAL